MGIILTVLKLIIILGIVASIHEFGHFLFDKVAHHVVADQARNGNGGAELSEVIGTVGGAAADQRGHRLDGAQRAGSGNGRGGLDDNVNGH